ncbi:MAG TPA: TA system VapC family ribonuclease toxin [Dongiaceae bacterium]|nr:TA system VapC family ribonuclease toxin [Dongiaceae bacterium]
MRALLDVNVLVALMWPAHEAHKQVQAWFGKNADQGWATCPFTQAGFLRIVMNPAFSRDAVSFADASGLLHANLQHPAHHFWMDEISLPEAWKFLRPRIRGHQQVTDIYLLGLAHFRKGRLVTLDRGMPSLLSATLQESNLIEVLT